MIVASQWKMSSSDLGPALQEVGGSFCKSARARATKRRDRSVSSFSRACVSTARSRRVETTADYRIGSQRASRTPSALADPRARSRATATARSKRRRAYSHASFTPSRGSSRATTRAHPRLEARRDARGIPRGFRVSSTRAPRATSRRALARDDLTHPKVL